MEIVIKGILLFLPSDIRHVLKQTFDYEQIDNMSEDELYRIYVKNVKDKSHVEYTKGRILLAFVQLAEVERRNDEINNA